MNAPCTAGRKSGRNAGYRTGCRCTACTAGARRVEKQRKVLAARGEWHPFVDAEPVRQHVNQLRAAGMGVHRIVELSGVGYTVVQRLVWGIAGAPTTKQMRPQNAAAILKVTFDPYDGAKIEAVGARRRIEALMCLGWSQQQIATRLGWSLNRVADVRSKQRIASKTARAIAALYDELWNQAPPQCEAWEKGSVTRTKRLAQRRGMASPLAWDDSTIDDPAAEPNLDGNHEGGLDEIAVERFIAGTLRDPHSHVSLERVEAVRRLAEMGMSDCDIGQRVGMTGNNVQWFRRRRGIPAGAGGGGVAA